MDFTEIIDQTYSLSGVWHWETVEVRTKKKGWQITRQYAPGEYTWEFSDEGTLTYRLFSRLILNLKYDYRLHEMLHIYNGRMGLGDWLAVEWLTTDDIILYPSDQNDPVMRRIKIRKER